jgi:hypothetical protein
MFDISRVLSRREKKRIGKSPDFPKDTPKQTHPAQPLKKKKKMDYLHAATGPKKAPAIALPSLPPPPSLEEKQIETLMDRLESKLMTFINQRFETILSNVTPLSSSSTVVSQVVDERLNTHLDQKLTQFFDQQFSSHLEQRLTVCFEIVLKRSLEHIDGRFSALLQQNK